jgi:tubulin-specific chaperone D
MLFDSLLDGLEDYTLDERGDVGSWIRMACIRGLTNFAELLFANVASVPYFAEYLPASKYHAAISGILRQGVERLDNVRQIAGEHILRLLVLPLPTITNPEHWRVAGQALMEELFLMYVFFIRPF